MDKKNRGNKKSRRFAKDTLARALGEARREDRMRSEQRALILGNKITFKELLKGKYVIGEVLPEKSATQLREKLEDDPPTRVSKSQVSRLVSGGSNSPLFPFSHN